MDNGIFLQVKSIIYLGITSGLFAGVISTLCSFWITKINNRNVNDLEKQKYLYSLSDYRYKELHKYLERIIDDNSTFEKKKVEYLEGHNSVGESLFTEYFDGLKESFDKMCPLLERSYVLQVEELYARKNACAKKFFENQVFGSEEDVDLKACAVEYIIAGEAFETKIIDVIQEQLSKLLQTVINEED